jgi:ubiquinone/menaquinone biosynthesis C-methylase UbiE
VTTSGPQYPGIGEENVENEDVVDYWESSVPWTFNDKPEVSYETKRRLRYDYQDFMHEEFEFDNRAGQRVVEVGCGAGIDAVEFAKGGADIVAIDPTETGIVATCTHFREAGVSGAVVQASGDYIPLADDSVDHVYSFGVLHHIPNVEVVLDEIDRVLRSEGSISGMLYNKDSLLNAYSIQYRHGIRDGKAKEYTPHELACLYSERNEGCPYTKLYTKAETETLLEEYFDNIHLSVVYDVIDTDQERKVKLIIPDKFDLGWYIIFRAERH